MNKKGRKRLIYIVIPIIVLLSIYVVVDRLPFFKQNSVKNGGADILETEREKDTFTEDPSTLAEPKTPEEYEKEKSDIDTEHKHDVQENPDPSAGNWWEYTKEIKPTKRSGNDLLVLVNKEYKLPSTYAPGDLVHANTSGIRVTTVRSYMLRSILINDLKALNDDAKKEGLDISMISGYRAYQTQADTYNYWVNYNGGNVAVVDQISARPGHSQHQLGTALDFSSSEIGDRLGSEFDNTKASKWLEKNAWKYGFVISYPKGYESTTGYSYESWHYRYIGRENAKEMVDSGKILEVWLRGKN